MGSGSPTSLPAIKIKGKGGVQFGLGAALNFKMMGARGKIIN